MPVLPTNFDEEDLDKQWFEKNLGHRIDTEVPLVVIGDQYKEAVSIQVSKYKEIAGNTVSALISLLPNKLSAEKYIINEIDVITDRGDYLEYEDDSPDTDIDRIGVQISFVMPNEPVVIKCTVKRKEEGEA